MNLEPRVMNYGTLTPAELQKKIKKGEIKKPQTSHTKFFSQ